MDVHRANLQTREDLATIWDDCGTVDQNWWVAFWITEISSAFLHVRELHKELGYKDTDVVADVSSLFYSQLFVDKFNKLVLSPSYENCNIRFLQKFSCKYIINCPFWLI